MSVQVQQIIDVMEELAPVRLAEAWDNPGLLVGSPDDAVSSVLVTLDVTMESVAYAAGHGIGLIISHHPVIFKKLPALRTDTYEGRMLQQLLLHHISVYSAHTNWDSAQGGVNDILAKRLGLQDIHGLASLPQAPAFSLGRIGRYPVPRPAREILSRIKENLNLTVLPFAGDAEQLVDTVALCGGAAAEFMNEASAAGAQLYLTGDVKYHEAQEAVRQGLVIADGGHYGTEIPSIQGLCQRLQTAGQQRGWSVTWTVDPTSCDIFQHC